MKMSWNFTKNGDSEPDVAACQGSVKNVEIREINDCFKIGISAYK